MYAIELPVEIDHTHQIHLQLPDTVKVGKAKIIVMYEESMPSQKPFKFGLDDFDVINLSGRDWRWMLDLLDNPNQPNQKMTAALEKYQNAKHDDSDTLLNWQP